jgi:hypothetical protein
MSSGQKQKLGIKQPALMTGGQQDLLGKLTGLLTGEIGAGVQAYPGQITPGPSGIQSQAFGSISDILGGTGLAGATSEMGMTALNKILEGYDPTLAMQSWEKGVKEPAMRTWTEEMIPQILESYGGRNALSSSGLQKTLAKSGTNLASDISGQLMQTLLAEKGQTTQAQLQGIPLTQMPLQTAMTALGAGITQRGIEAEQLAEPYQKWQTEQPYANPWLQQVQPTLEQKAFENIAYPKETMGGGVSCCFIFIEGERFTDAVRQFRDAHFGPNSYVSKGYKLMAKWLVPWMKKSKIVKKMVQRVMLDPLLRVAIWTEKKSKTGCFYIPVGLFWCFVWGHSARLRLCLK